MEDTQGDEGSSRATRPWEGINNGQDQKVMHIEREKITGDFREPRKRKGRKNPVVPDVVLDPGESA